LNTSVQIKTHSNSSAKNKNTHILRNSEAYKNPNILLLEKKEFAFKKEKEIIDKKLLKDETNRQYELKKINSSINTYKKRLENATDENQKIKLEKKLNEYLEKREDLKQNKSSELKETRGRKKEKNFVELEFSLTRSNSYKNNKEVQQALISSQNETIKNFKMFDKMEVVTNVMHKDQHSLHTHLLLKLPKNKTFDNLLKGEIQEQGLETGRNIYKSIQNFFNNTVREKLKALNIMLEEHTTGKKYTSLKKYKEVNPISQVAEILKGFNRNDNSALENIRKTFTPKQTPERIERDRLEKIKKEQGFGAYLTAKNEIENEKKTQAKKFGRNK
jgi:hypothetical protein